MALCTQFSLVPLSTSSYEDHLIERLPGPKATGTGEACERLHVELLSPPRKSHDARAHTSRAKIQGSPYNRVLIWERSNLVSANSGCPEQPDLLGY